MTPLSTPAAQGTVAGWKLVPVEPTQAMNNAGSYCQLSENGLADEIYAAMLSASPPPEALPASGVEITDEIVARVADAIDRATVGYSMRLTRLVDEESTYTLTYEDGEKHEFPDIDDGYAHIRQKKLRAQAVNVLAALTSAPAPEDRIAELEAENARLRRLLPPHLQPMPKGWTGYPGNRSKAEWDVIASRNAADTAHLPED